VGAADQPHVPDQLKAIKAELINGRFTELYDAAPSAAYLFRPDGYVCARWRALQGGDLMAAIETAMGRRKTPQA
jgi:3-(3-hydroxy-phenyl)propionate hydroxylase